MNKHAGPIYHLTPASYYLRQPLNLPYRPEGFDREGFIHCTGNLETLVEIANTFFADLDDELLVLEIDPARLSALLKFEPPIPPATRPAPIPTNTPAIDETGLFPHIYGLLNRQAIVRSFSLKRSPSGRWQLPD